MVIANKVESKNSEVDYSPQLIAPLVGVLNATFAQEKEMKKTFGKRYLIESERKEVPIDTLQLENFATFADKTEAITPILPLGRYLSNTVIRSMENNLSGDLKKRLDSLVSEEIPETKGN
jgi:hypothetical protein